MFELTPWNQNQFFAPLRDMEALLGTVRSSGFRTDVSDQKDYFLLEADLPGMRKEDISVQIDQNYMTIQACRQSEREQKDHQDQYVYQERCYGSYSRSFDISGIQADQIKAKYENGVLQIILPKKAAVKTTPIQLDIQS